MTIEPPDPTADPADLRADVVERLAAALEGAEVGEHSIEEVGWRTTTWTAPEGPDRTATGLTAAVRHPSSPSSTVVLTDAPWALGADAIQAMLLADLPGLVSVQSGDRRRSEVVELDYVRSRPIPRVVPRTTRDRDPRPSSRLGRAGRLVFNFLSFPAGALADSWDVHPYEWSQREGSDHDLPETDDMVVIDDLESATAKLVHSEREREAVLTFLHALEQAERRPEPFGADPDRWTEVVNRARDLRQLLSDPRTPAGQVAALAQEIHLLVRFDPDTGLSALFR